MSPNSAVCPRHLIETTARPLTPHRSRSRPFEVENLRRGAQADPEQSPRRQQRDVMAGRAIDLHKVAPPEILDPRRIAGRAARNPASPIPY